jgi:hypothetical protein
MTAVYPSVNQNWEDCVPNSIYRPVSEVFQP